MPSIKDVAKHSGVSYATVSNVINNKGSVSEETRKKVEEAIEQLQYIPHADARTLKGNVKKVVGVIIPTIDDPFLTRFYMGVQESLLINYKYMINLIITNNIASIENEALNQLLQQRVAGLILMSCQPDNRKAFRLIEEKNIPLVLVDRYIDIRKANFVSFNYKNIGSLLCSLLLEKNYKRPALITGPSTYSSKQELIEGFKTVFKEGGRNLDDLTIVTSVFNRFGAFKSMIRLLNFEYSSHLPDVVVTSSRVLYEGAREALAIQGKSQSAKIAIISLDEENWLTTSPNEKMSTIYRPAKILGKVASDLLVENIKTRKIHTPKTKILNFFNLTVEPSPQSRTEHASKILHKQGVTTLNLFMLNDNSTWSIHSLLPDFKKRLGIKININIHQFNYEELYQKVIESSPSQNLSSPPDIIMVDNPWFPHLVKNNYLVELSKYFSNEEEDFKDGFIPQVFENYSRYRDGYYALPFHFEVQLLFYRKDLFNDEGIKRNFFKKYGVELNIPKSWDEYNAIAEFFTKQYNNESSILFGNTAAAATTTICDYLPRLWAYGGSIFDKTGQIALDTFEAIEALKCYIKSFQYAHPNSVNYWYWDEVEEFAKGKAAMMIMFIAHTSRLIDLEYSNVTGKFGVCELPGGYPVLSGWSLGIHTNSPSKEVAYEFIKWSSSLKIAIPYTILGGCTPRSSLNQTEELLNLYPYFIFAEEQFQKSRKRTYPFDELVNISLSDREFEIIVHRNIRKAVTGTLSPEAALKNAVGEIQKHKLSG